MTNDFFNLNLNLKNIVLSCAMYVFINLKFWLTYLFIIVFRKWGMKNKKNRMFEFNEIGIWRWNN